MLHVDTVCTHGHAVNKGTNMLASINVLAVLPNSRHSLTNPSPVMVFLSF